MPFLFFFTVFALLDFVLLFAIGSQIGLLTTLIMVIATGVIGLQLVRRQGVATLQRAQQRFAYGELPSGELMTGAALIFGGALLMSPGFLSDVLGFMCLIPGARRWLGRLAASNRVSVGGFHYRAQHRPPFQEDWSGASRGDEAGSHEANAGGDRRDAPLEGEFISRNEPRR